MGMLGWFIGIAVGAILIVFAAPVLFWPLIPQQVAGGWRHVVEIMGSAGIMFASWRLGSMAI